MVKKYREWVLLLVLLFVAVLALWVNQFTYTVYDLNLYEYFKYSQSLSEAETDYLRKKEILYYTSDNNAPPFTFQDKNTGLYKGFIIDYASALSIELNTEIKFIPRVWEEAVQSVVDGRADMIELYPSEDRKKYLNFTESIYELRAIILTRNNQETIENVNDLKNHRVAIEAGDYANEYIKNHMQDVEVINTVDYLESVNLLLNNEVDAIIGDEPILVYFTGDLGIEDEVNILDDPLYEMDICIGVNKSDPILTNILNKGILDLKKTDFSAKIQQKWFGLSEPVHKDKINAQIMFLLIIVLTLLAITAAGISVWTYFLKRQVEKQTEELSESKNDLQLTFDAISDFLIVIDENGKIENVNKSFLDWLQKNKDDVVNEFYRSVPLLDEIRIDSAEDSNEAVYKGRHYNYYITNLEYGNKRMLLSIEDNTNEIISSRQMLQHNKMIAVGQLAAGLAHEIRNPLGIIRNYAYVLKNKLRNSDEVIDKSIFSIESSVLRASKMVENLLNFSRSNTEFSCVFLKEAIKDIAALEKKAIDEKQVTLNINCENTLEFCTKIESLTHVILNLLTNAVDSVSMGGTIDIDCYVLNHYLHIDFKDDGSGIEEQNLEHIFNPFFTTKKAGKGTGLGLYIVYNELQKINGEIEVKSKVNEGSEFKMKFKIKEEKNDRL